VFPFPDLWRKPTAEAGAANGQGGVILAVEAPGDIGLRNFVAALAVFQHAFNCCRSGMPTFVRVCTQPAMIG